MEQVFSAHIAIVDLVARKITQYLGDEMSGESSISHEVVRIIPGTLYDVQTLR